MFLRCFSWNYTALAHSVFQFPPLRPKLPKVKLHLLATESLFKAAIIYTDIRTMTLQKNVQSIAVKNACSKLLIKILDKCADIMLNEFRVNNEDPKMTSIDRIFEPFSTNPTKWSNTLKQFVGNRRRIVWLSLTILWVWRLKDWSRANPLKFFC